MPDQCEHTRADGTRCRARPLRSGRFCYYHDPAIADQRDEANRRGGRSQARRCAVLPPNTPDFELKTVGDVATLLATSINLVLKGQLDVKNANATGYLASVLLRALEADELEQRVAALEAAQREQQAVQGMRNRNGATR